MSSLTVQNHPEELVMATEMEYALGTQFEGLMKELRGVINERLEGLEFEQRIFVMFLMCAEILKKLAAIRSINFNNHTDGASAERFLQEQILSRVRESAFTLEEGAVILAELLRSTVGSAVDEFEHRPRAH